MNRKSVIWLLLPAFMGVLLFALFPIIQIIIPTFQTRYGFWGLYSTFLRNTYNWKNIFYSYRNSYPCLNFRVTHFSMDCSSEKIH